MAHWRAYFDSSGVDIWTVIQQALVLAATDFPPEFRERRCDIAQLIFERRPIFVFEGDGEGLCSSVATNDCTFRFEADANGNIVTNDEHVQRQTSLFLPNSSIDAVKNTEQYTIKLVDTIKNTLNDPLQAQSAILDALQTLESLDISVEVLKRSKIGKLVSNLRKHSLKDVQKLAKRLVRQWKELVDEWVSKNDAIGSHERDEAIAGLKFWVERTAGEVWRQTDSKVMLLS